jgi:hypothetical protein
MPLRLGSNQTERGWLCFNNAAGILDDVHVDTYQVTVVNSIGQSATRIPGILMEVPGA